MDSTTRQLASSKLSYRTHSSFSRHDAPQTSSAPSPALCDPSESVPTSTTLLHSHHLGTSSFARNLRTKSNPHSKPTSHRKLARRGPAAPPHKAPRRLAGKPRRTRRRPDREREVLLYGDELGRGGERRGDARRQRSAVHPRCVVLLVAWWASTDGQHEQPLGCSARWRSFRNPLSLSFKGRATVAGTDWPWPATSGSRRRRTSPSR